MRAHHIKFAILATLKEAVGFLTPETSLFSWTNLRLPEAVSEIEFQSAMRELEGQKRILNQPDEDGRHQWKITDNGLARLKELGG